MDANRLRNALIGVISASPIAICIAVMVPLNLMDWKQPNAGASAFIACLLVYHLTIRVGFPFAGLAFWMWLRKRSAGRRELLTLISISVLAVAASLGWLEPGILKLYGPMAVAQGADVTIIYVGSALAFMSGLLAVLGKGAGRRLMLVAFGLIILAAALGPLVSNALDFNGVSF